MISANSNHQLFEVYWADQGITRRRDTVTNELRYPLMLVLNCLLIENMLQLMNVALILQKS